MKDLKLLEYPYFIPDLSLLSCELDNLRLKCYTESFYIKQNKSLILSLFL